MDYTEFLDGVLLFRTVRDTDPDPEAWMERWLAHVDSNNNDRSTVQVLRLMTKVTEMIDPRKDWLLDEIGNDLQEVLTSLPLAA